MALCCACGRHSTGVCDARKRRAVIRGRPPSFKGYAIRRHRDAGRQQQQQRRKAARVGLRRNWRGGIWRRPPPACSVGCVPRRRSPSIVDTPFLVPDTADRNVRAAPVHSVRAQGNIDVVQCALMPDGARWHREAAGAIAPAKEGRPSVAALRASGGGRHDEGSRRAEKVPVLQVADAAGNGGRRAGGRGVRLSGVSRDDHEAAVTQPGFGGFADVSGGAGRGAPAALDRRRCPSIASVDAYNRSRSFNPVATRTLIARAETPLASGKLQRRARPR
jgi:hypothetical protein